MYFSGFIGEGLATLDVSSAEAQNLFLDEGRKWQSSP